MTREEAIKIISQMIKDEEGFLSDNTVKAHKMAIKALEQEPATKNDLGVDCISRQAVLDCLTATGLKKYDFILNARNKIKSLPSVKPQERTGHWIEKMDACECPYCHKAWDYFDNDTEDFDYCPKCGAKMDDVPDTNDGKLSEIPTGSEREIKNE